MNEKDNKTHQHHAFYRLAGAVAQFTLVSTTLIRINNKMQALIPYHPELKKLHDLSPRYATVWSSVLQLLYTCIAFACDLSIVLKREYVVPNAIRTIRHNLLFGLIFPVGISINIGFWCFYSYDRELVFPSISDLSMTLFDNIVCHAWVCVYAVFELAFMPRNSRSYVKNPLMYQFFFEILYYFVSYYTRYVDYGVWLYPYLKATEGSPLFYVVFYYPVVLSLILYHIQWKILDAIWKCRDKSLKKN